MQKAIVILMMFFLGAGLTQPSGYIQYFNLHEKYAQCSLEDHDLNPLDFIFEHLLNLETIINFIEGEHEYEAGDHPHEPFQTAAQSISLVLITPPNSIQIDLNKCQYFFSEEVKYAFSNKGFYLSNFQDNIFRPPIFG
ncbi:MAG: hypothetical protein V4561_02775 [Bacteroidota bacterium]